MSEGDYTPRSHPPKPLTRAQLREMQKQFKEASVRIDEIKALENKEKEGGVDDPKWM